jgi:hypothetical protein
MDHDSPLYMRFVGAVPVFQFQSTILPGHPPPPELELLDELLLELLDELLDDELLDDELLDDELLEPLLDALLELLATLPPAPPIAACPPAPPLPLIPPLPPVEDEPPDPAEVHSSLPLPPSPPGPGSCNPVAQAPTRDNTAVTTATRLMCRSMTNSEMGGEERTGDLHERTTVGREDSRGSELTLEKPQMFRLDISPQCANVRPP